MDERRDYCDICADVSRLTARVDAMEEAVKVASANLEKRLDGMDVDGKFLPRSEFTIAHDKVLADVKDARESMVTRVQHDALSKEVGVLQQGQAKIEGKASTSMVYIGWAIAIISVILHFIKT